MGYGYQLTSTLFWEASLPSLECTCYCVRVMHVSEYTWRGQRTASAIAPHLIPCLRWSLSLLIMAVYAKVSGLQASGIKLFPILSLECRDYRYLLPCQTFHGVFGTQTQVLFLLHNWLLHWLMPWIFLLFRGSSLPALFHKHRLPGDLHVFNLSTISVACVLQISWGFVLGAGNWGSQICKSWRVCSLLKFYR